VTDPIIPQRLIRVALTGGIATGKSHVRAAFERLGAPTIDSDLLARQAVAPGSPGLDKVVARFGTGFLDGSGALNRRAMADLVFRDADARRDLERIIHPEVRHATDLWFRSLDPAAHPFAIADIPLLFESGREGDFDAVVATTCEPDTQIQRLMMRDSLSEPEARQRIAAQLPLPQKVRRADFVIDTDGSYEQTDTAVVRVMEALRKLQDRSRG
jgi:dephospho-CoA kinase